MRRWPRVPPTPGPSAPDMSLAEQERALFNLLFDAPLRARFCAESVVALADYDLNDAERADFAGVRAGALQLDARLRAGFVLAHLCRAFPLSFSLASSLPGGTALLRGLVDAPLMRTAPVRRAAAFGTRLRERLATESFSSPGELAAVLALVEAELGMALTAAGLREAVLAGAPLPATAAVPGPGWQDAPLSFAAHVSAATLPRSYPWLKSVLCPGPDTELWTQLEVTPTAAVSRSRALAGEDPRVLLARARVARPSACDVDVDHATVELGAGFAPLLQHVDGGTSTTAILAQMRAVGAADDVLQGIESAFRQLLAAGMLAVRQG